MGTSDDAVGRRKGSRLRAEHRVAGQELVTRQYAEGRSIRQISAATGFSIGLTRNLLLEGGTVLRPRGGRASSVRYR